MFLYRIVDVDLLGYENTFTFYDFCFVLEHCGASTSFVDYFSRETLSKRENNLRSEVPVLHYGNIISSRGRNCCIVIYYILYYYRFITLFEITAYRSADTV